MGYRSEQKDYYESESQMRVLHIPNVSKAIDKLNEQMLKLPHENQDPSSNYPTGCTTNDILDSIERGVENIYTMLAPQRMMLAETKDGMRVFEPKNKEEYADKGQFAKTMEKLEWCYLLMEEADMLNDRLIDEMLPGDEDTYDFGGVGNGANDGTNKTTADLPAPLNPLDDKTVGAVEAKDEQGMA